MMAMFRYLVIVVVCLLVLAINCLAWTYHTLRHEWQRHRLLIMHYITDGAQRLVGLLKFVLMIPVILVVFFLKIIIYGGYLKCRHMWLEFNNPIVKVSVICLDSETMQFEGKTGRQLMTFLLKEKGFEHGSYTLCYSVDEMVGHVKQKDYLHSIQSREFYMIME